MKKSVIIGVAFAVCVALYLFYQIDLQPGGISEDLRTYQSEVYGFSFSYPDAYTLSEQEVGTGERSHYSVVLTQTRDLPPPENGEGPPTISVDVYQNNIDWLSLIDWLTRTNFSNFKLSNGTYASTSVSGVEAVRYRWSGLYEGYTVAFSHRDSIVAVSGTYLTPSDAIVEDFESVLSSIRLSER